jgi:hypothetical protein
MKKLLNSSKPVSKSFAVFTIYLQGEVACPVKKIKKVWAGSFGPVMQIKATIET